VRRQPSESARIAAQILDTRLIQAQDAAVTATLLQNVGPVLQALQPTKDAVIRAGAAIVAGLILSWPWLCVGKRCQVCADPLRAANVAHGLGHGLSGAVVAAWPAVALVGSYELLMVIIRSGQVPAGQVAGPVIPGALGDDPVQTQAAQEFADEVAAGRVPSVRVIRARLHVGQPRAQRVRTYLAALADA
jgi:hypothetical protein